MKAKFVIEVEHAGSIRYIAGELDRLVKQYNFLAIATDRGFSPDKLHFSVDADQEAASQLLAELYKPYHPDGE